MEFQVYVFGQKFSRSAKHLAKNSFQIVYSYQKILKKTIQIPSNAFERRCFGFIGYSFQSSFIIISLKSTQTVGHFLWSPFFFLFLLNSICSCQQNQLTFLMFNFKQISEGWRILYVNSEVFCGLRDWKFLMNKTWVTCKKNKQQFGKNSYVSKIFMSLKSFCLKNSHVSKFMMSQKFLFSFLFLVILNLFCIFIKKHSNFNYGKRKIKIHLCTQSL